MTMLPLLPAVDVFIVHDGHMLLGHKQRGIGMGLWNGFGGKVHDSETLTEAAMRETQEECGLIVRDLRECARLLFTGEGPFILEAHFYTTNAFDGVARESDEMQKLTWFPLNKIPWKNMWEDFGVWMPMVLEGNLASGFAHYENHKMVAHKMVARQTLPPVELLLPLVTPYASSTPQSNVATA